MTTTTKDAGGGALIRFFRVLRRRKVLVFVPPLVFLALALAHSASEDALYRGKADVLLNRVSLQNMVDNQTVVGITGDQFFQIQKTQAHIAHSPVVARRALTEAGVRDLTVGQLLDRTTVSPERGKDLIRFQVEDPDRDRAQRLAKAFAQQYVAYRRELDTAALRAARTRIQAQLRNLRRSDDRNGTSRSLLTETRQRLTILQTLQLGNATYVPNNYRAAQVQPTPVRDAIVAVLLGLMLGVGATVLVEAFDTRVRTAYEAGDILDIPFLGYLPPPPRHPDRSSLWSLESPNSRDAEAYRQLALNLHLTDLGPRTQAIMISSAVEGEGKSITAANLAVTLARSSNRVALVDLDLREPTLHGLFGVANGRGITDVILGLSSPADVGVAIESRPEESDWPRFRRGDVDGELVLFPAGPLPPNPGEFVNTKEVRKLVESLKADFDYVLLDVPTLLSAGDGLTLSSLVDGVVLVLKIGATNRPLLNELDRLMLNVRAPILGFADSGSGSWQKSYGLNEQHHAKQERHTMRDEESVTSV